MNASVYSTVGAGTSDPTGDAAIDSLVAMAGQTAQLPVGEHKAVYSRVIEGLERELNADPAAAVNAVAAVGNANEISAPYPGASHPRAAHSSAAQNSVIS